MPSPVDLSLIPVICTQVDAPKYNGKCFMEAISEVQKLNGESISSDRGLTKADFTTGDLVVIKFKSRDYTGVVDFSLDQENRFKACGLSTRWFPAFSPTPSRNTAASASVAYEGMPAESLVVAGVATESVATATAETRTRKRIREDYPLPTLIVPKPKKR